MHAGATLAQPSNRTADEYVGAMAHRSSVKCTEDLCTITCIILSCADELGILLSWLDGRRIHAGGKPVITATGTGT